MFIAWAEVRDNSNDITYLLATYDANSKTDIAIHAKGTGGIQSASQHFPRDKAIFGGARLESGRFVKFVHNGESIGVMLKGRASMHKNGVLNVLEGCDTEIKVWQNMKGDDVGKSEDDAFISGTGRVEVTAQRESQEKEMEDPKADGSEEKKTSIDNENKVLQNSTTSDDKRSVVNESGFVDYNTLKTISDPSFGIDPSQKEMALCDEQFEEVFKMSKELFASLPAWKKTSLKKGAMLF
jgi:hypothetical protein